MYEVKLENLYQFDFHSRVLNSLKQRWDEGETFSFIGAPKKQHLFIYLINCRAVYTMKNGEEILVDKGNIAYIPEYCEYKMRFFDCDTSSEYNSIAINFKLYDKHMNPFRLSNKVNVYSFTSNDELVSPFFFNIADNLQFPVHSPAKIKSLFYELLFNMSSYYRDKKIIAPKYKTIAPAIHALENHNINDISVQELAELCNVSNVYFRKLFREYSGVSPIEYKTNALISQAKQQLIFSNKSIKEIADVLGFSSAAYFCRLFKRKTGITPMEYIEQKQS